MKKLILLFTICTMVFSSFTYGQQRVKASYYADKFHGKKTASGEIYNRDSLTCAHKTYPFGTILRVKNLRNDKVAYVKVTDRGPHIKGRSIDLSYAAAKKIGAVSQGVFSVEVEKTELKQIPQSGFRFDDTDLKQPELISSKNVESLKDTSRNLMTLLSPYSAR
ncbi:MAG: septal ring lytic transglycosylase RlpA family protein [Paludibacteraceae bacterium]